MTDFKPGQKWISNAEPELGMGQVMSTRDRLVSVYFELAGEQRTYSRNEAPLTRVRFSKGDRIATQDDLVITVTSVADRDGVFVYHGDYNGTSTAVVETELDPNVRFSKPAERLFTRQLDDNAWFVLRYRSLSATAALASASARGLYGP
ncbi:MAG: RNA polymerase-associated protein RapA, partial [Proteobacteria bacterium]|nr:RNA polymerase-associated protein RapA [Pseudomonadota bacterium]